MSFLKSVTKGKIKQPFVLVVYGPDGVGKSTFASQAPDPVFMGSEKGTFNLDVARGKAPKTWADVMADLKELAEDPHDYKTLVIDSLDWIEPLVFAKVCADNDAASIEKVGGGYGKGYTEAMVHWLAFKDALERLREERKMNVILIGHADTVKAFDPDLQLEITRYQLKLWKKASDFFREFADAVLFANYVTTASVNQKKQTVQAVSDGSRVAYTERRHGHDAKNRFGLPETIELRWGAFIDAVRAGEPESVGAILARIEGLMSQVTDGDLKAAVGKYVEDNKMNAGALLGAEMKLKERLGLK